MNFTVWVIKSLVWLHLYSCVRMSCQKWLKRIVCTDCLSHQVLRLSQISLLNIFVKFHLINILHASLVMWGTFPPLEPPSLFFSWNHHHLSSTINSSRSTVTYLDNFFVHNIFFQKPLLHFLFSKHHHNSSTTTTCSVVEPVTFLLVQLPSYSFYTTSHFYFYNQHQSHVYFRNIIKFDLLGLSWHFFFLQPLSHSF